MNNYEIIMVRFGELSTKGKNKKDFIRTLYKNIKAATKNDFPSLTYELRYDHIYIDVNDENIDDVLERLQNVSGIHAFSLVHRVINDIDNISSECLRLIKEEKGETFKIKCKRGNKRFPLISDQITRIVASNILKNTDLKVDVHNPDILLNIDVRDESTYIFLKTIKGLGGYPLGVGGKAMMMLSGGIDSPVAAFLLMKRGVMIECIHYASPPYTQQAVIYKLIDLLKVLNIYQSQIRLHIVPFTKIQEEIYDKCDESYAITIMRRMMYRLATLLAKKRKCPVIANGESIGQVASQTLQSMNVINSVTNYPVIRPLATYDKLEIIAIAEKIKTYDISVRPYEDCCTIFTPKNPKTMPDLMEVEEMENRIDFEPLLHEAIKNVEVKIISIDE